MTKHLFNVYETRLIHCTYEVELDTDNPTEEEVFDMYLNGDARLIGESDDVDPIDYEYDGLIED